MAEQKDKEQGAKSAPASSKASYAIVGIEPGNYHFPGIGELDLTTVPSDEVCENLLRKKFPYIGKL